MKNQEKNTKSKINNLIFWGCLVVLICAVAVGIWQGYKKHLANQRYDELRAETVIDVPEPDDTVVEQVDIPIDFATIQSKYPNAYAWITIPDTQVDYPIMQSTEDMEDDYYLEHTIDDEKNLPGAIYTQRTKNQKDLSDTVTVIYGHNMRNDSMFGSLHEYKNEEYRAANPYIYIYTPEHIFKYEVFAAVTYSADLVLSKYDCNNNQEAYEEFLDSLRENNFSPSWISEEIEVSVADRIVVLSTCNSNDDQRYLVCGVLVEEQ